MTCATCHQPIHWNEPEQAFYHNSLAAILACDAIVIQPERETRP